MDLWRSAISPMPCPNLVRASTSWKPGSPSRERPRSPDEPDDDRKRRCREPQDDLDDCPVLRMRLQCSATPLLAVVITGLVPVIHASLRPRPRHVDGPEQVRPRRLQGNEYFAYPANWHAELNRTAVEQLRPRGARRAASRYSAAWGMAEGVVVAAGRRGRTSLAIRRMPFSASWWSRKPERPIKMKLAKPPTLS